MPYKQILINIGVIACFSLPVWAKKNAHAVPSGPLVALEKRLKGNGFPVGFRKQLMKYYDASKRDQVVKLNVMGFLLSADYSGHISPEAMRRCRDFLEKNKAVLQSAEKRFGVKKELITALLWVETRLGENVGRFHVASVFLSLLQAEHPELKNMLLADLHAKVGKPTPPQIKKVKERSKIKGRWAVGELWALYKMNKKNAKTLSELKGSHSGAFGLSQFLPSSYNQWAVSFKHGRTADLYRTEDAILSVAHYLKENGYRRGRLASYKKALFHYNRSEDYVATILALASKLEA